MPFLNGSVLDFFMVTRMTYGLAGLSTAMSWLVRWQAGSKEPSDGTVISPEREKPKKP